MKKKQHKKLCNDPPQSYLEIIHQIFKDEIFSIEKIIDDEVSDDHSPSNAKGTLRYIRLVTNVRKRLCDEYNWKSYNKKGSSFSISPDRCSALMIRTGNSYTGDPNAANDQPKTNNKRVSKSSKAILNGQERLNLKGDTELLLLLHRKSKDGKTMNVEISKVSELDGESIISLTDRYCFSIDMNKGTIKKNEKNAPKQDDFIVEDFPVERK